jgi:hypothetical protein
MINKNNRKTFDIRNSKCEAARTRQVACANRTIEQQLERLKQRPGRSARETVRLIPIARYADGATF